MFTPGLGSQSNTALRPGNVIEKSGRIFEVVDAEHKQRGRGGAILTLELRDVDSGNKQTLRFGAEEAVESMFINFKFLTPILEKFEQLEVPLSLFGQAAAYLKEEMKVKMQFFDGRPLSGSIPKQVTCIIKETQDHAATPRYKKAVLDNGLIIQVPTYVETGEEVVVNTEDGSFVTRANK
ncbi:hypothetical protein SADUNF_Sadunf01G0003900 [Salix dunnii]|uniref:Elongation factor P n=1 Tax=Salix dunnii TaxID=1413687 RepID=A0A835N9L1_9ROSI|nr:hypothetical protein SADUNF_Sadunf01G0003900 [Salix dunnii]